ncbi:MAG: hypothetical protein JW875_00475 [Spirochaetales bacterium]|nr:hypothetical protein [Spirochaetales bacterium]
MIERDNLILVGPKHSGKSSVGTLLAGRLNIPFLDTDTLITEISGKTPRELYDEGGAVLMMAIESQACALATSRHGKDNPCVLATGGGLADNQAAKQALSGKGSIIYLEADFDVVFDRIMESARRDGRLPPFLQGDNPKENFRVIFTRRAECYVTMCSLRVQTGLLTQSDIVEIIISKLFA